jgi:hypothetical protein
MNSLISLSVAQLKRAAAIKEKIAALEKELAKLVGGSVAVPKPAAPAAKKKRKMSAAGLARIKAAQKARWAKIKNSKRAVKVVAKAAAPVVKKKFKMSAAAKAKISAAAKARWEKIKAAKKA